MHIDLALTNFHFDLSTFRFYRLCDDPVRLFGPLVFGHSIKLVLIETFGSVQRFGQKRDLFRHWRQRTRSDNERRVQRAFSSIQSFRLVVGGDCNDTISLEVDVKHWNWNSMELSLHLNDKVNRQKQYYVQKQWDTLRVTHRIHFVSRNRSFRMIKTKKKQNKTNNYIIEIKEIVTFSLESTVRITYIYVIYILVKEKIRLKCITITCAYTW